MKRGCPERDAPFLFTLTLIGFFDTFIREYPLSQPLCQRDWFSFEYQDTLSMYKIDARRFLGLLRENPGLVMKLHYVFTEYLFL